jgi:hypothetical protein
MSDKLLDFKVNDRQSFIAFVELLRLDFLSNHDKWENKTIDDFLGAFARYTEDIQGYYDNTNQNINADTPNWKVFADALVGASIYE